MHQHDPHTEHRCRRACGVGTSGHADGRGCDGTRLVDASSAPRPRGSRVGRPRPVRAVGGPRKHAALQPALPDRLRAHARRPQAIPALGKPNPRAPRTRSDEGHRSHDRPARAGLRERGRNGDRGTVARCHVQSSRPRHRRSSDVRPRERRRLDGGRLVGGGVARGQPPPRSTDRSLRREQHHALGHDQRRVLRRRRCALRRLWLARPGDRRDGRRSGRRGAHRGSRRRASAVSDRGAHAHRIREPAQARHVRGAWRAARKERSPTDEASVRLARRRRVSRAGRGPAGVRRSAHARRSAAERVGAGNGCVSRRPSGARRRARARGGGRASAAVGREAPRVHAERRRHGDTRCGSEGDRGARRIGAESRRRLRRPRSVDAHDDERRAATFRAPTHRRKGRRRRRKESQVECGGTPGGTSTSASASTR